MSELYISVLEFQMGSPDVHPKYKFPTDYDCNPVRYHVVKVPSEAKGGIYNQRRVIYSFEKNERGVDKEGMRYFSKVSTRADVDELLYWESELGYINLTGPDAHERVDHDSVWDFFDYIGYNRKIKKFKEVA